jgi:5-formyltetrahydrofolate cyclo-ligase
MMDSDATTRERKKTALRERFAAYRAGLARNERARQSAQAVERLQALPEIRAARTVHCYWPQGGEIDTRAFVEAFHAGGGAVALPVVTSFAEGTPAMTARRYEGRTSLRENRWGLAEPADDAPVISPGALDAVVVPAFGAGRSGGRRIGHGRGFYDAFLAQVDAPAVALVYDACLVERVPAAPHDVAMDALVTETQTVRVA